MAFGHDAGSGLTQIGTAALSVAPLRFIQRGGTGPLLTLAPVLFVVANVVIGSLAAGTLVLLFQGRLLPAGTAAVKPPAQR